MASSANACTPATVSAPMEFSAIARREEADQRLSAVQPGDLVFGRRCDLDHDIGRPRIPDAGTGFGVQLVGEQRAFARTGLDHHRHTAVHQRRDGLGHQRDAPLAGPRLGDHTDRRLRICHGAYIYFPHLLANPVGLNTLA